MGTVFIFPNSTGPFQLFFITFYVEFPKNELVVTREREGGGVASAPNSHFQVTGLKKEK